jgi:hypothetical protein
MAGSLRSYSGCLRRLGGKVATLLPTKLAYFSTCFFYFYVAEDQRTFYTRDPISKANYNTFVVNRQYANMLILTSTYIKGSLLSKLNRKMEKAWVKLFSGLSMVNITYKCKHRFRYFTFICP